ncbi:PfkB family carbohydrate kinase [Lentzea sp. DG1S-22]|uniref:PfkB family carbohydrate kinase n=1 Tax=Lentzea sp. DG1S-22 TaxID=3108822 RepID=UPI002E768777|nr:PfkB family carbohydrate kinase [Lentzea sp. DG1S-22]WVH83574.1 PfkB family carbohydrate kinase [Lentzea sp. DG1S-22]
MEEVVVVGQIARDLVLVVDEVPDAGGTAPVRERREMLGGKGANIAVSLAQLGAPVALVGVVGDDDVGERLIARAAADGIATGAVVRRPDQETGLIVDVVADGWRYLEHLPDALLVREEDLPVDLIEGAAAVVVQLQQPPEVALKAARAARGRVVLDGAPERLRAELLECADVVRADHREAELLTGRTIGTADDAVSAARELMPKELVAFAVDDVGNVFVWDGGELVVPLGDVEVVDTTGGGDAFVAALTFALTRGDGPEDAARLAVEASGATVTHPGGRPNLTGR